MRSPWLILCLAGVFEICWAIGLKYSRGFTVFWPSLFTLTTLAISMILLAKSAQKLPIGTAYAVWVGIGAMGAAVIGVILFKEPVNMWRVVFLVTLLISIVGLKITSVTSES